MVHQEDLAAWEGMPVEALDTQTFFLTLPVVKRMTDSGIEIRNYSNRANVSECFGSATLRTSWGRPTVSDRSSCTSQSRGCDNIFYIKDGKVLEYAPTGQCFTDVGVRPQARYLRLTGKAP